MAEITIDAEITIKCECGQELSASMLTDRRNGGRFLEVAPCVECLKAERETGSEEGYNERNDEVEALEQKIVCLLRQVDDLIEQLPPEPLPDSAAVRPLRFIQH